MQVRRLFTFTTAAVLLAGPAPVCLLAADTPVASSAALDPYTQAVHDYVQAASKEVAAIRGEAARADKTRKAAYAPVLEAADRCDALIEQLKSAGPSRFDRVKSEYEKSRAELTDALTKARQG